MINFILNAKSFINKKNIKCRSGFFNSFFLIKKLFSFPFLNEISEYLQNLVIPYITLIINNSKGAGGPNIINNDNQGNNIATNENKNALTKEGNNQEAILHAQANQQNDNQLNENYG